jgi:subtilisin
VLKSNKIAQVLSAILIYFHPIPASAGRPIVVAVIDTGISDSLKNSDMLCKYGHRDFTGTSLSDNIGHGTHISGLIDQYVKDTLLNESTSYRDLAATKSNYCQVILKFIDPLQSNYSTGENMIKAIRWAIDLNVDVINISAGGPTPIAEEEIIVKTALNRGIRVIVAAGNDSCELGSSYFNLTNGLIKKTTCNYFPAMYDPRIYVVGNLNSDGTRATSSNYGHYVNSWENGMHRKSLSATGSTLIDSGTSQAAAIKTGKIIRSLIYSKYPR